MPRGGKRRGKDYQPPPDEERYKGRPVSLTDAQWEQARRQAQARRLSTSEYIRGLIEADAAEESC